MNPFLPRKLARSGRLLLGAIVLGLAAGCASTQPPAANSAVPAAPVWTLQAESAALVRGVYQSAYSTETQRLYITSAVGRPPVRESRLLKVDPVKLTVEASAVPPVQASRNDGQLQAVYGVAVDDAHDQVWVTNTRSGSVAVYRQADLALVRQFPDGTVPHARDVLIDAAHNRAYVSTPASPIIHVFDTATLQALPGIALKGADEAPKPMSLAIDATHRRLYTVSLNTAEAFVIDLVAGRQIARHAVPGAMAASGVAVDDQSGQIYIASQKSGDLIVLDGGSGQVLRRLATGAGALNVAFDPVHRLAYVANRGAGTTTVVNDQGVIQAQIDSGSAPNHVTTGPDGTAWLLVKTRGKDDSRGDRLVRIEASKTH